MVFILKRDPGFCQSLVSSHWCHETCICTTVDILTSMLYPKQAHADVIKWKKNLRYWPFVRGVHRWPVNSPHKGQWRGALMFSLICTWTSGWANHRDAGDLRRHRAHYVVTVLIWPSFITSNCHFTSRYFGGLKQELWDNVGTMSVLIIQHRFCSIQYSSCQRQIYICDVREDQPQP